MPNYNWKRFLNPLHEEREELKFDKGFLADPEADTFLFRPNQELTTLEDLENQPCLFLLGEPGIGKSTVLTSYQLNLENKKKQVLLFDLSEYGEATINDCVFKSKEFEVWKEAKQEPLYIFLDSLDEYLLRMNTIGSFLRQFEQCKPLNNLYLRIACRTADETWATKFIKLWAESDEHKQHVYKLTPLRQKDVAEAVKHHDLEVEAFFKEIWTKDVTPFAAVPITLEFLIASYKKFGQLPQTKTELYLGGCQTLCGESNKKRQKARLGIHLDPDQRLAIAQRIAAVMMFCGKNRVENQSEIETTLAFNEVIGGDENVQYANLTENKIEVSQNALEETLATALFTLQGKSAHQTFIEFLAACYIDKHRMKLPQIRSLITSYLDGKIPSQLQETVAWLANMNHEVFSEIVPIEPELLLRCDVGIIGEETQVKLVDELIRLFDEHKLLLNTIRHQDYAKLKHSKLDNQLRAYLIDKTKSDRARHMAIKIAEACNVSEIQLELLDILFNPTELLQLKIDAIGAITYLGDEDTKAKLRPFALGQIGYDPYDELKGWALTATWPKHLTSMELFGTLTKPKRESFIGVYYMFLSSTFTDKLKPVDLPIALAWVEQQEMRDMPIPYRDIINSIIRMAWEHLDNPKIVLAFARIVVLAESILHFIRRPEFISNHRQTPFDELISNQPDKRHLLIEAIVTVLSDYTGRFWGHWLIKREDFSWLVEKFEVADNSKQWVWREFIAEAFRYDYPGHFETLYFACQRNSFLAEVFTPWFEAVTLNSPQAHQKKAYYLEMEALRQPREVKKDVERLSIEEITKMLDRCLQGDLSAWWQLVSYPPYYGNEIELDLTKYPGWQNVPLAIQAQILTCAKKYLTEYQPEPEKWLTARTVYTCDFVGAKTFWLLLQEESDYLTTLSTSIWQKWVVTILARHGESEPYTQLVKLFYEHIPVETLVALIEVINHENKTSDYLFVLRKMVSCWDDRLKDVLQAKLQDETLTSTSVKWLMEELLAHQVDGARVWGELIVLKYFDTLEDRAKVVVVTQVLLTHTPAQSWSIIWQVLQDDYELGREVVMGVAYNAHSGYGNRFKEKLTEAQLANLYLWLCQQFPHQEDPNIEGGHPLSERELIARWRDKVLNELRERGTIDAVKAIERIAETLPQLSWLLHILAETKSTTRDNIWRPLSPKEFLKLVSDSKKRLVRNGQELLYVVKEALQKLQEEFKGELSPVFSLWNEAPIENSTEKSHTPKDENRLSDFVGLYLGKELRDRNIIVSREVQINRGKFTDIHVDVFSEDRKEKITAIVEIKGNFYGSMETLKDKMRTQLAESYLMDNNCRYGLYLIGWFNCDKWDAEHYKKTKIPKKVTFDEAKREFSKEAAELSKEYGVHIETFVLNTALR